MTLAQIPVIDISKNLAEAQVATELIEAATTYGFLFVKNFGQCISTEAIENVFTLSKNFFASPVNEKMTCRIQENVKTLSLTRALNIGQLAIGKCQQPIPKPFVGHESEIDQFQQNCHELVLRLLFLFGIGLKIEHDAGGSDWFASRHRNKDFNDSILRFLHYPPIPSSSDYHPTTDIRAGAHSDYGSLTLLFQRPGQTGLEILLPAKNSGQNSSATSSWEPVPIFPSGSEHDSIPPILVNVGDLLSYWTNGYLKSTIHRVVFPQGEDKSRESRYSIAYFSHPTGSTILEPVPSPFIKTLKKRNSGDVKSITADEHLKSRLRATHVGLYKSSMGINNTIEKTC